MQTVKYLKNEEKINADEYTNYLTGETLHDEVEGDNIKRAKKFTKFEIDSNNYVVFDSLAVEYLCRELSGPDVARVLQMGNMIYGDCSVVVKQENKVAHSSETLSEALEMEISKFYNMVRKLVKKGILSYCVCAPSGYVQKIYMLNPYIARKNKRFNNSLHDFFSDITQPNKKPTN